MEFNPTPLNNAFIIKMKPIYDDRGFFSRTFCKKEFDEIGLNSNFVQCNTSFSKIRYTLRGMHFQKGNHAEAKLIRCIKGAILDVIIDIRRESDTFLKHYTIELTDKNNSMLYIPEGYAHGYITLKNQTEVFYQVTNYYTKENEGGIRWNDPLFNISWPTDKPILSEKDSNFADYII